MTTIRPGHFRHAVKALKQYARSAAKRSATMKLYRDKERAAAMAQAYRTALRLLGQES